MVLRLAALTAAGVLLGLGIGIALDQTTPGVIAGLGMGFLVAAWSTRPLRTEP